MLHNGDNHTVIYWADLVLDALNAGEPSALLALQVLAFGTQKSEYPS